MNSSWILICPPGSLPTRRAATAGLFGANRVAAAGSSLRLSGGATSLNMGVLDGIKALDIDGKEVDLGQYSQVPAVLVVNLASGAPCNGPFETALPRARRARRARVPAC